MLLLAGQTLRLHYESSAYAHNVFAVPNEDAFDQCLMDGASEVAGGEEGVTSLDITLDFPTAGTFYYVCARYCDPVSEWCHCMAFTHKLRVHVEPTDYVPTPTTTAAACGRAQLLAKGGHTGRVQNSGGVSENRPACGTAQHTLAVCFVFEKFRKNLVKI